MKRILSILLTLAFAFAMLLGLFACGRADTDTTVTSDYDVATPRPEDKPSRMIMYNASGELHATMTYVYNQKGDVLRSEQRMASGQTKTNTYENHYNGKGQLVERYQGESLITYEYNDDGQLIQMVDDTYAGLDLGGTTRYSYNQQGQLIRSDFLSSAPSTSFYEYDEQGLLIREDEYMDYIEDDEKPEKPSHYYIYEYD